MTCDRRGHSACIRPYGNIDPGSRNKFSTLAWRAVKWAIMDYLKRLRPLQRHQSSDAIADSGDDSVLGMYARNSVDRGGDLFAESIRHLDSKNLLSIRII